MRLVLLSFYNPPNCSTFRSDSGSLPEAVLNLYTMNYQTIKRLQKEYGYQAMQMLIDNGSVWRMEGSMGREAMRMLETGACMLPTKSYRDYYGNRIPARTDLEQGTKGTFHNSIKFYTSC